MTGGKDGTDLAPILDDASVTISVALQYGVFPSQLAKSVARLPAVSLAPPYDDQRGEGRPGSVIGAALDLLRRYERGGSAGGLRGPG